MESGKSITLAVDLDALLCSCAAPDSASTTSSISASAHSAPGLPEPSFSFTMPIRKEPVFPAATASDALSDRPATAPNTAPQQSQQPPQLQSSADVCSGEARLAWLRPGVRRFLLAVHPHVHSIMLVRRRCTSARPCTSCARGSLAGVGSISMGAGAVAESVGGGGGSGGRGAGTSVIRGLEARAEGASSCTDSLVAAALTHIDPDGQFFGKRVVVFQERIRGRSARFRPASAAPAACPASAAPLAGDGGGGGSSLSATVSARTLRELTQMAAAGQRSDGSPGLVVVTTADRSLFGSLAEHVIECQPYKREYGKYDDVLDGLASLVVGPVLQSSVAAALQGLGLAHSKLQPSPMMQALHAQLALRSALRSQGIEPATRPTSAAAGTAQQLTQQSGPGPGQGQLLPLPALPPVKHQHGHPVEQQPPSHNRFVPPRPQTPTAKMLGLREAFRGSGRKNKAAKRVTTNTGGGGSNKEDRRSPAPLSGRSRHRMSAASSPPSLLPSIPELPLLEIAEPHETVSSPLPSPSGACLPETESESPFRSSLLSSAGSVKQLLAAGISLSPSSLSACSTPLAGGSSASGKRRTAWDADTTSEVVSCAITAAQMMRASPKSREEQQLANATAATAAAAAPQCPLLVSYASDTMANASDFAGCDALAGTGGREDGEAMRRHSSFPAALRPPVTRHISDCTTPSTMAGGKGGAGGGAPVALREPTKGMRPSSPSPLSAAASAVAVATARLFSRMLGNHRHRRCRPSDTGDSTTDTPPTTGTLAGGPFALLQGTVATVGSAEASLTASLTARRYSEVWVTEPSVRSETYSSKSAILTTVPAVLTHFAQSAPPAPLVGSGGRGGTRSCSGEASPPRSHAGPAATAVTASTTTPSLAARPLSANGGCAAGSPGLRVRPGTRCCSMDGDPSHSPRRVSLVANSSNSTSSSSTSSTSRPRVSAPQLLLLDSRPMRSLGAPPPPKVTAAAAVVAAGPVPSHVSVPGVPLPALKMVAATKARSDAVVPSIGEHMVLEDVCKSDPWVHHRCDFADDHLVPGMPVGNPARISGTGALGFGRTGPGSSAASGLGSQQPGGTALGMPAGTAVAAAASAVAVASQAAGSCTAAATTASSSRLG